MGIVISSSNNEMCKGLTLVPAATEEQALNIYFDGDKQKTIAEHALNKCSSRSHTICTIYVDSRYDLELDLGDILYSTFYILYSIFYLDVILYSILHRNIMNSKLN